MKGFFILFLCFLCSCDMPDEKVQIRSSFGKAVVRITGQGSGGTGFVIKSSSGLNYILTNKHICELAVDGFLNVEFPGNRHRKFKRRVIEESTKHDLCLVESIPNHFHSLRLASSFSIGEQVFVVGHPKLHDLTVAEGTLIQKTNVSILSQSLYSPVFKVNDPVLLLIGFKVEKFETLLFNVYSRGGNSGSPILNDKGQVISVLFAGNRQDVMETHGVPFSFVKEFLKGY